MAGVADLVQAALDAGLTVHEEQGQVVVRGPRAAAALAQALLARKDEVRHILALDPDLGRALRQAAAREAVQRVAHPLESCWCCGSYQWWQRVDDRWVCNACHPAPRGTPIWP